MKSLHQQEKKEETGGGERERGREGRGKREQVEVKGREGVSEEENKRWI